MKQTHGAGEIMTEWLYGTTIGTAPSSLIARNDLVKEKNYLDHTSTPVKYFYNQLGEVFEMEDQNGTKHAYEFDGLGRLTNDKVTALGSGIDNTIRRLVYLYDQRGFLSKASSYAATSGGSPLNQCWFIFDDWGHLLEDRQAHGGTALSTSPKVVYTYAYGTGGKFLRRTGMTYPDSTLGVAVRPTYDFGTAGGANDVLNWVGRIYQSLPAREFVEYGFAGASRDILVALGSGVKLSFGTGANNYDAYDRFGRVLRMKWEKHLTLSSADDVKEWIEWDYDRVSNRKWRWNRKAAAAKGQDELYTHDGLYRSKTADRGGAMCSQITSTWWPSPIRETWWRASATRPLASRGS